MKFRKFIKKPPAEAQGVSNNLKIRHFFQPFIPKNKKNPDGYEQFANIIHSFVFSASLRKILG